jgi:hypothetical protein
VWAIIGYYLANGCSVSGTAAGYDIPEVEVEAVLAFYRRFKWAIDARLAENDEFDLASALAASA